MNIEVTCDTKDNLSISDLKDFQGQLKTIDHKNLERLKNRIKKVGINVPVFVWKDGETNYILDGHQRIKALKSLEQEGYKIPGIPIVYIGASNLDDAKEKLLSISSQYGDFQLEMLKDFSIGLDLKDLRLTKQEITLDYDNSDTKTDDSEIQDSIIDVVKMGDIITFGEHRLICGDSTKTETYTALIEDEIMSLVITDPPYNMNYTGSRAFKRKAIENDKMTDEEFATFLSDFMSKTKETTKNASWYIFMGRESYWQLRKITKQIIGKIDGDIIWDKGKINMSGSDYQRSYENCLYVEGHGKILYAHDPEEKKFFVSDRNLSDVWHVFNPLQRTFSAASVHPTTKPVELYTIAMRNSSSIGSNIIDPFAGSGTIFIAAEKMKRKAFAIEMDTKYCAYIIARYLKWCAENEIDQKAFINEKQVFIKDLIKE